MKKRKQPDYIQPDLQPEDLAKSLYKARPKKTKKKKKAHHGPRKIVRSESYRGHDVRIETTYKITIDGKAVNGHLDVTNAGQVHYHPLPNRSTSSAIEMVRAIIDSFPDDFPSPVKRGRAGSKGKKRVYAKKAKAKKASSSSRTGRKGGQ